MLSTTRGLLAALTWALVAITEGRMQTLPVKLALFTGEYLT